MKYSLMSLKSKSRQDVLRLLTKEINHEFNVNVDALNEYIESIAKKIKTVHPSFHKHQKT